MAPERASVDRLFAGLLASLNTFASLWIVFLVGVISVDVIGRTAFNVPLPGVPEITRLLETNKWQEAAALLREGHAILPNDPAFEKLWLQATGEASFESVPNGASVHVRFLHSDPNAWELIGTTPFSKRRLPDGYLVWRISKPGFADLQWKVTSHQWLTFSGRATLVSIQEVRSPSSPGAGEALVDKSQPAESR